ISMEVSDKGPGIEDIDKAMEDGYSTASEEVREMGFGAGMGLSNIKNNSDELEINSTVNEGTELKIVKRLK
ncbi:MAG: ATP-binding protein, partial [Bacteroidota bacterium]